MVDNMSVEEVVNSLRAEDHFYASYDPAIFTTTITEIFNNPIKELLCVFNEEEQARFLIFVPKPFGLPCNHYYHGWVDKTLAIQWNHLWIQKSQLVRIFLRKTSI